MLILGKGKYEFLAALHAASKGVGATTTQAILEMEENGTEISVAQGSAVRGRLESDGCLEKLNDGQRKYILTEKGLNSLYETAAEYRRLTSLVCPKKSEAGVVVIQQTVAPEMNCKTGGTIYV